VNGGTSGIGLAIARAFLRVERTGACHGHASPGADEYTSDLTRVLLPLWCRHGKTEAAESTRLQACLDALDRAW